MYNKNSNNKHEEVITRILSIENKYIFILLFIMKTNANVAINNPIVINLFRLNDFFIVTKVYPSLIYIEAAIDNK